MNKYKQESSISDDSPILLVTENQPSRYFVPRRFKFENHWLVEEDIEEIVKHSWPTATSINVEQKLEMCVRNLDEWSCNLKPSIIFWH